LAELTPKFEAAEEELQKLRELRTTSAAINTTAAQTDPDTGLLVQMQSLEISEGQIASLQGQLEEGNRQHLRILESEHSCLKDQLCTGLAEESSHRVLDDQEVKRAEAEAMLWKERAREAEDSAAHYLAQINKSLEDLRSATSAMDKVNLQGSAAIAELYDVSLIFSQIASQSVTNNEDRPGAPSRSPTAQRLVNQLSDAQAHSESSKAREKELLATQVELFQQIAVLQADLESFRCDNC
jgi:hypothetical protein